MFAPKAKSAEHQSSSISNRPMPRLMALRANEARNTPSAQENDSDAPRADGQEAAPSWNFSKIPLLSPHRAKRAPLFPAPLPAPRLPIQAKLRVGAVDDPLEHEADRVADQVMRMPAVDGALTAAPPQISRKSAASDEEEEKLQKKEVVPAAAARSEAPPSVHEALRAPGQPLDASTRAYFEPRFGRDFSDVRVHSAPIAAQSAREVNAFAYTVGRNIAFDTGRFAPLTLSGRRLLAHELTHVVQQSCSGGAPVSVQRFAEGEHKAIGDVATGSQTIFLAPDMPVTYGEIVALGGDYFGDWETLYRIAIRPGITEGTRGEVWYAILVKIRPSLEGSDAKKAENDGLGKFFDRKAKEAVEARHVALSASNIAHFPNPRKGDAARSQAEKDNLGSQAIGAGASYRANHVTALTMAAAIGQQSHSPHGSAKRLNDALFIEAFGDHFLTDAFAGGHQQTERASVQQYWNNKLPDFWSKVQRWMAQAIVLQLRKTNRLVAAVTPQFASAEALGKVEKATAKLPQLGFGDLASGAIHDYFNLHGAEAEVAGRQITLFGDSQLLEQNEGGMGRHVTDRGRDTFNAATAAVRAGIEEVHQAYALGHQGEDPQTVPDKIFKAGGGLFAAEKLMPQLTPDAKVASPAHKSINWEVSSYKELLADRRFAEGLKLSLTKYADQVAGNLSGLSADEMDAVAIAVTRRMKADPVGLIEEIINYVPVSGGGIDPGLVKDLVDLRNQVTRSR